MIQLDWRCHSLKFNGEDMFHLRDLMVLHMPSLGNMELKRGKMGNKNFQKDDLIQLLFEFAHIFDFLG